MAKECSQVQTAKRIKRVLVGFSIAVASYVLAVVGVYVYFWGSAQVARSDPAAWGQFGDYVGGLLNPLFALLNVVIVAYIAIAVQRLNEAEQKREQQSEERVRTVLDLHREWNSEPIYRSRTLAGILVRKYPSSTVLDIEKSTNPQDAVHLWVVVGFFLRLGYLAKQEKLQDEMVIELFGELFVWWWTVSFERQLMPVDWDARDQIGSFKEWLFKYTTEERRAPWIRRGLHDLKVAQANAFCGPLKDVMTLT